MRDNQGICRLEISCYGHKVVTTKRRPVTSRKIQNCLAYLVRRWHTRIDEAKTHTQYIFSLKTIFDRDQINHHFLFSFNNERPRAARSPSSKVECRRLKHCPQRQVVTVESRGHDILGASWSDMHPLQDCLPVS